MSEITCQQCGKRFTAATRHTRYCPDCAKQRIRERARDQQRRSHGWTEAEIAAGCRLCADCGKPTGDPYRTYCPDCARQRTRKSIISRSRRQAGWTDEEIVAGRRAPKSPKRLCALCGNPTGNSRRKYCPACAKLRARESARLWSRRRAGWTEEEIAAGRRTHLCVLCGKPTSAANARYCPECAAKRAQEQRDQGHRRAAEKAKAQAAARKRAEDEYFAPVLEAYKK